MKRVPHTGGEKQSLLVALDRHRDVMLWKLEDLNDEQLRRELTPSSTNLIGLVKHLAVVEYAWFCLTFERPVEDYPIDWDGEGEDADMRASPGESTADIIDYYQRARAAADTVIQELDLETVSRPQPTWADYSVSLRWVLIHMIEETARHAGHADILRELIDGTSGYHPE